MNLNELVPFLPFYLILSVIMGSFFNMLVWRLPRKESLGGRSHCFSCGHVLSAKDLVPIFSWLFLRGRCRYCGIKIPFRYLWLEVSMLLSWSLCWGFSTTLLQLSISTVGISLLLFAIALWQAWPRVS